MGRLDLNKLRLMSLALPQRLFIRLTQRFRVGCLHLAQLVCVALGSLLHLSSRSFHRLSMSRLEINKLRLVSLALPQGRFICLT